MTCAIHARSRARACVRAHECVSVYVCVTVADHVLHLIIEHEHTYSSRIARTL